MSMTDCLFCRIVNGEIPSFRIYEDDAVIAFLDIKPVNPGHVLVVPKKHSDGFHDADPETLKRLIVAAQKVANGVATAMGTTGFNLEENNGAIAGQVIPHLHLHVVPRRADDGLKHWPGTPYQEGEIANVQERLTQAINRQS
jgi:histidine triad (HIT) family protein